MTDSGKQAQNMGFLDKSQFSVNSPRLGMGRKLSCARIPLANTFTVQFKIETVARFPL